MQRRALAEDGDDLGLGGQQRGQPRIMLYGQPRATRRPERTNRRVRPFDVAGALEKRFVLGIRTRPPGLDERDPERVEPARYPDLVLERERQSFPLGSVAERRVVEIDHGRPRLRTS